MVSFYALSVTAISGIISYSSSFLLDYRCTVAHAPPPPPPLADIVHRTTDLNTWKKFSGVIDPLLFLVVFLSWMYTNASRFDELLIMFSILHIFRILCFWSTLLPPPRVTYLSLGMLHRTNYDLMFSGHAMTVALFASAVSKPLPRFLCMLLGATTSGLLVLGRHHYTVDVLVGGLIGWLASSGI